MNIKTRFLTALIYPFGDVVAQLILGELSLWRFLSLCFLAFAFYIWEIPKWFNMLDSVKTEKSNLITKLFLTKDFRLNWLGRTFGAIAYFNPLWIARHMFFISLSKVSCFCLFGFVGLISSSLVLGVKSFLANLPISIIGNYIIQVKLKSEYRFLGSVLLSSFMAICYALAYKFLR